MRAPKHVGLLIGCFLCLLMAVGSLNPLRAAPSSADAPDAAVARLDIDRYVPSIHDYQLANGLRVLLVDDETAPVVAVNVAYRVGGADDPPGRSGFAHLFEHLMFHGSANVGRGEFDAYLTEIGADSNAYTSADSTVYFVTVPANYLPLALWLESDRMGSLVVDQEGFETERQVVIEELNETLDSAYGPAYERIFTLPYQGYAPYEHPVIGSAEDLNAATLEEIRAFHAQYYLPNNATLALVGDIDIPQTKALIEAYFGDIPAGAPVAAALDVYPPPAEFPVTRTDATSGCAIGHEETLIDPRAELPSALAAVVGPGPGQPDYYALGVLANILATGDSSRLSQNILDEGLASSIWAGHMDDGLKTSEFIAQIIPNAGDEVTGAADLLRAEFANVRAEGVTEAELQRAKNQIQLNMVTGFRDSAFETTEWLQWFARVYGDPDQLEQELAGYLAVTAEDVQRVAQTYLCDRPMSWITVLQEGEAVTSEYPGALVEPVEVSPDPLDGLPDGVVSRTSPPTALPDVDMALAPFTSFELDNGLDVIFVAQTKTPQLTAALYVGSSDAALPADQQGLAALLADLLTKGTDTRAADEISAAIEDIGGEVAAEANTEYIVVQASGPATARTVIFDTLADITLNPTFPATEFAIAQEQQLSNLEFVASDPDTLAWQQYQRIAFPGHPYGLYATPETVTALAPDDLADFHTAHLVPDNAVLVIAGDLTADEAQAEAERAFGDWAGDAPAAVEYPEAAAGDTSAIYLIDLPDAEQATILAGNRSASVNDPDRFALYVANHILGGTFNSRLNYNLREEHGYTYGVYSSVDPLRAPGYFYIYGSVGQDVAGPALAEVLYELDRLQTAPIPDEELADAQSYLISSYLMRNADMDTYARTLGYTAISGLDPETVNAVVDNYAAVSAADAQAAARRYIEAEQPVIVVAASAAAVQAQLEELGEVVVVDAEGNPLE